MTTIAKREQMLNEALRNFEKDQDYAFIAGFYSSMIKWLASDRIEDFTYAMELLRRNTK
jgi:hypothetical protein